MKTSVIAQKDDRLPATAPQASSIFMDAAPRVSGFVPSANRPASATCGITARNRPVASGRAGDSRGMEIGRDQTIGIRRRDHAAKAR